MALNLGGRREILVSKEWRRIRESISPERNRTWVEPKPNATEPKVPVIYYLFRNGHLEHPHFMEVPLASSHGLHLRDVTDRLNFLRGEGFADMFSWSSKRSYKNGFVWQDLSDNDFIYPSRGHEYILKGSELLDASSIFQSYRTLSSSPTSRNSSDTNSSISDPSCVVIVRGTNQSSEKELHNFQVYKARTAGKGIYTSTQTADGDRKGGEEDGGSIVKGVKDSPANSGSANFRKVEGTMEGDGHASLTDRSAGKRGGWKSSTVLMQLIRCASRRPQDWELMEMKG